MTYIPAQLRRLVEERANFCCEYCQLPADLSFFPHEVDHVIAEKHGGAAKAENLAYSCWRCNRYKGSDLGSFDPQSGQFSFLFHPRTQSWTEHFRLEDHRLIGLTPFGRTTVALLQLNSEERIIERRRIHEANSVQVDKGYSLTNFLIKIKKSPMPWAKVVIINA